MDEDTANTLANTLNQSELIKELMSADQTMTNEQARDLISKNMMRFRKDDLDNRNALEIMVPEVMRQLGMKG